MHSETASVKCPLTYFHVIVSFSFEASTKDTSIFGKHVLNQRDYISKALEYVISLCRTLSAPVGFVLVSFDRFISMHRTSLLLVIITFTPFSLHVWL